MSERLIESLPLDLLPGYAHGLERALILVTVLLTVSPIQPLQVLDWRPLVGVKH